MIKHGPEVLERRDRHPEDPPRADDEQLARVAQVAGQEDDQADLGELRRLEDEQARDADPEVGAVGGVADDREARQHHQPQRHGDDHVAVALELAVVAEGDDRDREQDESEHEPLGLLAGQGRVDPVDHHQAEAGQDGHQREQVGIGVGQRHAQEDVPGQAQAQEDRPVGQRDVGEVVGALDVDPGEAGGDQQRGGDQPDELPVARTHGVNWPSSAAWTRLIASFCERSWWSNSLARRAAGTAAAGSPDT